MIELLPLVIFTTFAGAAAGAYIIAAFKPLMGAGAGEARGFAAGKPWLFPLTCIVLLGIGLLGTLAHLGQPMRFINGMMNPGSMISQESYWAIAFGVLMVVDLVIAKMKGRVNVIVRTIAAIAACGLVIVTGLAYYRCSFIAVWSEPATIALFAIGNLMLGAAVCLVFTRTGETARALPIACLALAAAWMVTSVAFGLSLAENDSSIAPAVIGGIVGGAVPAALSCTAACKALQGKADYLIAICAVIGVIVVRTAFFAAGIL